MVCRKTVSETFGLIDKSIRVLIERKQKGKVSVQEIRGGPLHKKYTAADNTSTCYLCPRYKKSFFKRHPHDQLL